MEIVNVTKLRRRLGHYLDRAQRYDAPFGPAVAPDEWDANR